MIGNRSCLTKRSAGLWRKSGFRQLYALKTRTEKPALTVYYYPDLKTVAVSQRPVGAGVAIHHARLAQTHARLEPRLEVCCCRVVGFHGRRALRPAKLIHTPRPLVGLVLHLKTHHADNLIHVNLTIPQLLELPIS